jgi:uncharacterized protein YodC (DUF2158 family)
MADQEQFKAGDVVRIKSGGPAMTVINPLTQGKEVWCGWWNSKSSSLDQKGFNPIILEKIDERDTFPNAL